MQPSDGSGPRVNRGHNEAEPCQPTSTTVAPAQPDFFWVMPPQWADLDRYSRAVKVARFHRRMRQWRLNLLRRTIAEREQLGLGDHPDTADCRRVLRDLERYVHARWLRTDADLSRLHRRGQ